MPHKTVLIVEDDAIVAVHLRKMLTDLGYRVAATVATGESAITAAVDAPPDLIMMDIELAGEIDGITAAGRIKESVDVPIIFLTSYSQDTLLKRAKTILPYGYLIKPVSPREMVATIEMAFHRHLVDRKLKESEARYAATVAAVDDGLWEWNTLTGQAKFSVIYYRMLGYQDQEFLASYDSWRLMVHPDDIVRVEQLIRRSMESGQGFNIELRMKMKTGAWKWFCTRGKAIENDANNTFQLFVGTLSDITERKQAEEEKTRLEAQNRQLQKAESLGRMAGAIAHHFNNQLGTVIGNIELAVDDLPRDSAPFERLTFAKRAARKAANVSNHMLTYLGQTTGIRAPLDLSETCRLSLPLLQIADQEGRLLKVDLPSPGPTISANANQIQQILTNLVTNAQEAVEDNNGAVGLSVAVVSPGDIGTAHRFPIDWQPQEVAYACLEVRDNGCGIEDDDINKLFDPFFSSKFAARGLGLSVALGLVKAHAGVITVQSEVGQGSTFRVFFPLSTEQVPKQQAEGTYPAAAEDSGTILLVEDEDDLRDMASSMLTRLGYTVLAAKDGATAVEVFRRHREEIRCVLSDLTMPNMDGWETLTALRKLSPRIPVILASGHDEARVNKGAHSELPLVFLHKPYSRKELKAALAKALEG